MESQKIIILIILVLACVPLLSMTGFVVMEPSGIVPAGKEFTGGSGSLLIRGSDLPPEFEYGEPRLFGSEGFPSEIMHRNASCVSMENGIMETEQVENTIYVFENGRSAAEFLEERRDAEGVPFGTGIPDSFGRISLEEGHTSLMFRTGTVVVHLKRWRTLDIYSIPVDTEDIIRIGNNILRRAGGS